MGDFNRWDTSATPLLQEEALPDVWSATVDAQLAMGSKYKLYVVPEEGEPYYAMPAWATRFVGPNEMKLLDAVVHPIEGSGPGRLEVTEEMRKGSFPMRGIGVLEGLVMFLLSLLLLLLLLSLLMDFKDFEGFSPCDERQVASGSMSATPGWCRRPPRRLP